MSNWKELPALDEGPGGCGNCQTKGTHLHTYDYLAVGFGSCNATKDNEFVYDEQDFTRTNREPPTLSYLEEMAAKDPDHDWRVHFFAPLYEAHYQRHRDGVWRLIQKGEGFA